MIRISDIVRLATGAHNNSAAYRYTLHLDGIVELRECYAPQNGDGWIICSHVIAARTYRSQFAGVA